VIVALFLDVAMLVLRHRNPVRERFCVRTLRRISGGVVGHAEGHQNWPSETTTQMGRAPCCFAQGVFGIISACTLAWDESWFWPFIRRAGSPIMEGLDGNCQGMSGPEMCGLGAALALRLALMRWVTGWDYFRNGAAGWLGDEQMIGRSLLSHGVA